MMISTIPKPNKVDIKAGFKIQVLTVIKGKPTYEKMKTAIHQLARNARTFKVSLGGEHGVLALVIDQDEFFDETGK